MKKIYPFLLFIAFLFSITAGQKAKASHAAGGELLYEYVSDTTYRFIFKFYRDCTGGSEPNAVNLCIRNACNLSYVGLYTVYKRPTPLPDGRSNGALINTGCPAVLPKCLDPNSTLPAYNEWWYEAKIGLPGIKCQEWKFSVQITARNVAQNTNNTSGGDFYVESTLNNLDFASNNSASFSVLPLPFAFINAPYVYNNGGADIDGDQLVMDIVQPQNTVCGGTASYVSVSPGIVFPKNPLSCNNTFFMDSVSGQFSFTPDLLGAHTLTQRIREYRGGKLIGSVLRDIQVQVMPGVGAQSFGQLDTPSLANAKITNGVITTDCGTKSVSFCFYAKSKLPTSVLMLSDNTAAAFPNATITYTNQGKDSVRGCFTWNLTPSDVGTKTLVILIKDSSCLSGIALVSTMSFVLNIAPPFGSPLSASATVSDDTFCVGKSITLNNISTGNPAPTTYGWSITDKYVMTGNNPYTISWSTPGRKYILLKAQNGPCFVHDTATVYVIAQADAHFNLPDNGCINAATILHPGYSEFSSYHWTIDEQSITDTVFVDPYFFNWTSTGKKIFSLRVNSLRGCGTDEFTDSIIIHERTTPPILGLGQDYYCLGEPLTVSTKEESGATYSWTPIDDFSGNNAPSINYHGKGGKIRLRLIDAWGCSAEDSADINVKDCCNLVLPGAFTPDNDGRNDKFGVINPEEYTLETFIVKNRWGNTVFETRDVNTGWDGTYKGQPQDGGTYFYFIKYNCPMKKTTISKGGDVVLVR